MDEEAKVCSTCGKPCPCVGTADEANCRCGDEGAMEDGKDTADTGGEHASWETPSTETTDTDAGGGEAGTPAVGEDTKVEKDEEDTPAEE